MSSARHYSLRFQIGVGKEGEGKTMVQTNVDVESLTLSTCKDFMNSDYHRRDRCGNLGF